MSNRLGHKQTAAMFTLMVLGREVPNPELREIVGFTLDSKDRRELNGHGYVTSEKRGRALAHTITERGVAWCRAELGQETPPPPRARSLLVPAMYLLLAGVDQYLHRANLGLTDVFAQRIELTSAEIEKRIEAAYRKLAGSSQDLVGLAELRAMLGGAATEDVDAVLKDMSKAGRVSLFPESNRKVLTSADHEAAIRIGGEDNHLISIEAS
ncbi:MAG TPA: hypothetical protein VHZ97_01450 [Pseudonocardiaceae bacterium]|jgi:hypothetical protein|nr:hypothetical protein [Pseudonocardiaceae bacterium]